MAVIESNNRILRAGDSPVGTRYFDGDYIHIDENNHINFTGDFSGLSAKVDECCADAHGQISAIKGSVSSLSSQFVDCCSSVNTDFTEIWNAVNANSANITNNSNNISVLSGNTALLDTVKLDKSAYTEAETVPWITAWKNVSNNLTANFGDTYCFLSSIDVSGNKNHAVGVKGSYITLPTTGHIASALNDKLDISSFSSYTSYADNRMDGIFQLANSAYTTAVNNYYNKADKSALSSYVPYSAIGGTTNIITGINGSALSAGANYTEGPNIKITGNEISGKDWTDDITAASANAVNEAVNNITAVSYANSSNVSNSALTANYALSSDSAKYDNLGREITATYLTAVTGDNIAYTAGDNIDITNHVISGKDWGSEISDASANAVNEAINNITAVSYAATANISNSALTANYALSSDSATYDSDGNKITETYLSALPEGVITTANTFVSSVNNLTPELVSGGINGHELKLSGSIPTGLPLSGVDPIKIEKTGGKVVISITGDVGTEYTAGDNIDITNHVISGKDWTNTITAASAYAASQATGNTYDVKASSNISVSTAGNTFTVSGKNWQNTITAASSYAYNQATANSQGKIYTGIDPIVVDNTLATGTISAWDAVLSAQWPLTIVTSYVDNYETDTIVNSGLTFSNVLGGLDNSIASAHVAHKRSNQYTEYYSLSLENTSGSTNEFTLIPVNLTRGWLRVDGNGSVVSDSIRESKIYNYEFTTANASTALLITASGYTEVHLTTPYHYDGPETYSAALDNQTFTLGSGCYGSYAYQEVEGSMRWVKLYTGTYSL